MHGKLIEETWLRYRNEKIPANAPSEQLKEMRRAFYEGCEAMWDMFSTRPPTPEGVKSIREELNYFNAKKKAGLA